MNSRVLTDPPTKVTEIVYPRNKVCLEMCAGTYPGHGTQGGYTFPNTPSVVLFIDGHVEGNIMYDGDYAYSGNPSNKKVLLEIR